MESIHNYFMINQNDSLTRGLSTVIIEHAKRHIHLKGDQSIADVDAVFAARHYLHLHTLLCSYVDVIWIRGSKLKGFKMGGVTADRTKRCAELRL